MTPSGRRVSDMGLPEVRPNNAWLTLGAPQVRANVVEHLFEIFGPPTAERVGLHVLVEYSGLSSGCSPAEEPRICLR
jgi:hypothetical protein